MTDKQDSTPAEVKKVSPSQRVKVLWHKAEESFEVNDYDWHFFTRFMGGGLAAIWLILLCIAIVFIQGSGSAFTSIVAIILVGAILSCLWLPISVALSNNARRGNKASKIEEEAPQGSSSLNPEKSKVKVTAKAKREASTKKENGSTTVKPKESEPSASTDVTPDATAWLKKQAAKPKPLKK